MNYTDITLEECFIKYYEEKGVLHVVDSSKDNVYTLEQVEKLLSN